MLFIPKVALGMWPTARNKQDSLNGNRLDSSADSPLPEITGILPYIAAYRGKTCQWEEVPIGGFEVYDRKTYCEPRQRPIGEALLLPFTTEMSYLLMTDSSVSKDSRKP